jgi:hypothetical protein
MVRLMHAMVCGEKLSVIVGFDGMDFSGGRGDRTPMSGRELGGPFFLCAQLGARRRFS